MNHSEQLKKNLFDNDMVKSAMKSMSSEQRENYKKIGKELYGTLDFDDSKILNNMPAPMSEAVTYVSIALDSGLHPSDLDDNEKNLMVNTYGDNWYEKWNYTKKDL